MKAIRLLGLVFFAVLAFGAVGAIGASTASAFHPLFLTLSGKTLLFLGLGKDPILRGERAGVQATILCEKVLVHGLILHLSTLVHLLPLLFEGDCLQKLGTGASETCKEHITTKPILGELGLLLLGSNPPDVVILLTPSDGTTTFVELECGGMKTTVGGTIVGEIPENFKGNAAEKQIETLRETLEIVFATKNKNNEQAITSIDLLGVEMTKQELKVEGFLGGKASEEASAELHADGLIRIDLKHP